MWKDFWIKSKFEKFRVTKFKRKTGKKSIPVNSNQKLNKPIIYQENTHMLVETGKITAVMHYVKQTSGTPLRPNLSPSIFIFSDILPISIVHLSGRLTTLFLMRSHYSNENNDLTLLSFQKISNFYGNGSVEWWYLEQKFAHHIFFSSW